MTVPAYDPASCQRHTDEPDDRIWQRAGDPRSPFVEDHTRILRSAALRALGGKTQTIGLDEGHIVRNRLTHSLEVAQTGLFPILLTRCQEGRRPGVCEPGISRLGDGLSRVIRD